MDQDELANAFVSAVAAVIAALDGPERIDAAGFLLRLERALSETPDALPMVELLRERVAKASDIGRLADRVDDVYGEGAS